MKWHDVISPLMVNWKQSHHPCITVDQSHCTVLSRLDEILSYKPISSPLTDKTFHSCLVRHARMPSKVGMVHLDCHGQKRRLKDIIRLNLLSSKTKVSSLQNQHHSRKNISATTSPYFLTNCLISSHSRSRASVTQFPYNFGHGTESSVRS